MEITKRKTKDGHSVKLKGELTIYEVQNGIKTLNEMPEIFNSNINLDASSVLECDTAGLQVLLYMNKKLDKGYVINLVSSNQLFDSLVDLLGLSYIFLRKGVV